MPEVLVDRIGTDVVRLTLNRPDVRNAFNEHVIAEHRLWDRAVSAPMHDDCRRLHVLEPCAHVRVVDVLKKRRRRLCIARLLLGLNEPAPLGTALFTEEDIREQA